MKLIISKEGFLDWRYSDQDDKDNLFEFIKNELKTNGKVTISLNDVFNSAGFIPAEIIENEKDIPPHHFKDNELIQGIVTHKVKWI